VFLPLVVSTFSISSTPEKGIRGKGKGYGFGGKGNRTIYDLAEKRIGRKGKGTLLAETDHVRLYAIWYLYY